uniref:DNA_mis_repair domain-containing protein n=2 Tax=Caenorhabditis japonica TaxID=281687 RepID=A0A8R1DFV2_CAEJA
MVQIQRLPQDVVNRMAAGEVLARPYNAIKELVENSLDAGATEIQVHMQNAGLKLLQVSDNGKGIERDDFDLVCERFATSKLQKFEDLMHMQTYGFRGEALASLSHVAKVNIVSKREDGKCAYQADYLDGKMLATTKPAAGKNGTCITATDLFYNLPVRRNKMVTHGEEAKMVYDTLLRFAIHRPDVSFALRQAQSNDFRTKGDGNLRDVVSNLLGREIADNLIPLALDSTRLKFEFSGNFSKPIAAATAKAALNRKTTRSFFSVFINGRSVRCEILKHPLDEVLQNRSLICQFCSVHLKIDETRIDVNVHPTKSSVIFLEKEAIIDEIRAYFEKVVNEIFGFAAKETDKNETQENLDENTSFSFSQIPIISSQSIKSIETFRRPSTSSDTSFKIGWNSGKNEKKRVDYMEVRTDSRERKLDEFIVRCPTTPSTNSEVRKRPRVEESIEDIGSMGDMDPEEEDQRRPGGTELDQVSMVSVASTMDGGANESQDLGEDAGELMESTTAHRDFEFESLEFLRRQIVNESSLSLRNLFKTCIFVGSIDPQTILVQFGTSLYQIDFAAVLREFFYQISIFSFGNYGSYRLEEDPPAIQELLELLGELSASDENYAAFEVFAGAEKRKEAEAMLAEHAELLNDYFAIKLEWSDENLGEKKLILTGIPSLVHYYVPQLEKLPFLIAELVLEVDYDDEKSCFESICRALGRLFSLHTGFVTADKLVSKFSTMRWKPMVKHILFPLVKRKLIPPESFKQQNVIKQLADAHDLYKVFERCGA